MAVNIVKRMALSFLLMTFFVGCSFVHYNRYSIRKDMTVEQLWHWLTIDVPQSSIRRLCSANSFGIGVIINALQPSIRRLCKRKQLWHWHYHRCASIQHPQVL